MKQSIVEEITKQLTVPSNISEVNWSSFVLMSLREKKRCQYRHNFAQVVKNSSSAVACISWWLVPNMPIHSRIRNIFQFLYSLLHFKITDIILGQRRKWEFAFKVPKSAKDL